MPTAADALQDLTIAHADELERSHAPEIIAIFLLLLAQSEEGLIDVIAGGLTRSRTSASLERLLKRVRSSRDGTFSAISEALRSETLKLSRSEAAFFTQAFTEAIEIGGLTLKPSDLRKLRTTVLTQPFLGRPLNRWARSLQVADRDRLEAVLRTAFVEGTSVEDTVDIIRGTSSAGFKDGILQTTRRQTEAVVRTSMVHATSMAREQFFLANSDKVSGLIWTSVLDSNTTPICMERDDHVAALPGKPLPKGFPILNPPGARPPAHVDCRSIMNAILNPDGIVGGASTIVFRGETIRFRQGAKNRAGGRWSSMTEQERRAATGRFRSEWAAENLGVVPAETTYEEFLRRQSAAFQDAALQSSLRGGAFRSGTPLSSLIAGRNRFRTHSQLRREGILS